MKIAIIGNQAFAIANFRGELIREACRRGHQLVALAPDYTKETRELVQSLGAQPVDFTMSRTGINPLADLSSMIRLSRLLKKLSADTSLCFSIKPIIFGNIAAAIARVPNRYVMVEGLGYVYGGKERKNVFRILLKASVDVLYKFSFQLAKGTFLLNTEDAGILTERGILKESTTHILGPIGVNLDDWSMVNAVESPITFMLAARLISEKGIFEYVEAARSIRAKYPECRFLLLGGLDSNPTSISQEQVEEWVREGVIDWKGHAPMKEWLAETSVFVLPSYYREGVPRSSQEAAATGRPIITTDNVGCRDTVLDGVTGFLIPPRDASALALAMEKFILHPKLITSMGVAGRKFAEQHFNVSQKNEMVLKVIGAE